MSNKKNNDNDIMRPLRLIYLKELCERQNLLEGYREALGAGTLDEQQHEALRALVHKLSGTGATYGFPQISNAASLLEDLLVAEESVPTDLIIFDLDSLLEACAAAHIQEPVSFASEQPASTAPEPAPLIQKAQLPLVLIVDDDESVRAMLVALIQNYARTITAANADDALELLYREPPDLILLDDKMPGATSGMKLLEDIQLVSSLKSIPVVMITATDQPEAVMRGLTAGAVDYIIKPFDPDAVGEKIKARLKRLGTTILIVDDDKAICELLKRKFATIGFSAQVANEGQAAIDMMRAAPPDLVLLDRMLPGFSGGAVLQTIREIPQLKEIPVIFLTARRQEADILSGFELGAADYIVKPFNPDEVVARCVRLLGTSPRMVA